MAEGMIRLTDMDGVIRVFNERHVVDIRPSHMNTYKSGKLGTMLHLTTGLQVWVKEDVQVVLQWLRVGQS